MDISIAEQFDINNEEWIMGKCKRFLRFIQENSTATRIEKELGDENHLFLPKYLNKSQIDFAARDTKLVEDRKFYEWESKDLDDIFVVIFRFLHEHYPDMNRFELRNKHNEKISEWDNEYPKYLKVKDKKKEAEMQNKFIKEVNDKWLPGFEYLYDFEYQRGNHKGDLIFANNHGILAAVETKRAGYIPWLIPKKRECAEEQAINTEIFSWKKPKMIRELLQF